VSSDLRDRLLLYWYGRLRALAGREDLAAVRAYLHAHAQIAKLI
jgi:hypothetical protein